MKSEYYSLNAAQMSSLKTNSVAVSRPHYFKTGRIECYSWLSNCFSAFMPPWLSGFNAMDF